MPLTVSGLSIESVRPAVSPMVELGCALHVLNDPRHHHASEWAATVDAKMTESLAAETRAWGWATRAIRATPFATAAPGTGDFEAELDQVRADPARLVTGLLRPVAPGGDPHTALRWARPRGEQVAGLVRGLVDHPESVTARFVEFLERSWQQWFAAEWASQRADAGDRARRLRDAISRSGPAAALAGLDPAITAGAPERVRIAKVQSRRHDVSKRGMVVLTSPRIHPHLYVGDVRGRPLMLVVPSRAGCHDVPTAAETVRRLDTLAHVGRLEVARAIATEARTAGEIAGLWNLDPTLVNRHLRALAAVGLASTRRRGRFMEYSLDASAVERIGSDVVSLLLR